MLKFRKPLLIGREDGFLSCNLVLETVFQDIDLFPVLPSRIPIMKHLVPLLHRTRTSLAQLDDVLPTSCVLDLDGHKFRLTLSLALASLENMGQQDGSCGYVVVFLRVEAFSARKLFLDHSFQKLEFVVFTGSFETVFADDAMRTAELGIVFLIRVVPPSAVLYDFLWSLICLTEGFIVSCNSKTLVAAVAHVAGVGVGNTLMISLSALSLLEVQDIAQVPCYGTC